MAIRFAKRMEALNGSEIRELLKLIEKPEVISFAGGLPAPELFPIEEMKEISRIVLEESGTQALQYSTTEGFQPLREQIARRMNSKNKTNVTKDDILITNGSQQGLDFAGRVFLNEGDVVLCESPSYLGAINAFKSYGSKFIEVPTDKDGMIMEELEKILYFFPNSNLLKRKMYYEIKNIVSTLSIFPERYIKIQNFRDNIRKLTINKFVIIYKVVTSIKA